jgi:hypothetical protein
LLLDSSLNILSTRTTSAAHGVVFSRDGQSLFLTENQNGIPLLSALAATDLHSSGVVTDLLIQGVNSEIEEAGETNFVFGLNNRGVSFLDGSPTGTITGPVPVLAKAPALTPSNSPNLGGTGATLSGQNFGSNPVVEFGGEVAAVTSSNASEVQATSPPSTSSGAVNVTAYLTGGGMVLAPDAFSYGPQILEILPNAGSNADGETVAIYGHGFGEDSSKVSVQIGLATANVQKIEDVQSLSVSGATNHADRTCRRSRKSRHRAHIVVGVNNRKTILSIFAVRAGVRESGLLQIYPLRPEAPVGLSKRYRSSGCFRPERGNVPVQHFAAGRSAAECVNSPGRAHAGCFAIGGRRFWRAECVFD